MNGSDDRDVAFNGRLVKEKKKNHRKDRKKAEEGKKNDHRLERTAVSLRHCKWSDSRFCGGASSFSRSVFQTFPHKKTQATRQ